MEVSKFEQLNFALSAYNDANRQSNSIWAATSVIAIFVVAFSMGSRIDSFLNFPTDGIYTLQFALIALSAVNISYCAAHANAYRIGAVYQSIVRESWGPDLRITNEYTWYDLTQRAPVSNFNRIYPLFMPMEVCLGKTSYRLFKSTYDLVFCGFPSFAIILGLVKLPSNASLYIAVNMIGLLSLTSIMFLARYIFTWPVIASDKRT